MRARGKFTASLVGITPRHLAILAAPGEEVQSEPIAVCEAGVHSSFSGSAPRPHLVARLFCSSTDAAPPFLSWFHLELCYGNSKRFAEQRASFIKLYPHQRLPICKATLSAMVLHHATQQEATHKMLHRVLDLSVSSGQVR